MTARPGGSARSVASNVSAVRLAGSRPLSGLVSGRGAAGSSPAHKHASARAQLLPHRRMKPRMTAGLDTPPTQAALSSAAKLFSV
jgi:hypothetical protein